MTQKNWFVFVTSALALGLLSRSAAAQSPTFVKIQEGPGGGTIFPGIGIKSNGAAAFRDALPERIRVGTATATSTLVTVGDTALPTTDILTTLGQADFSSLLALSTVTATGDAAIFTKPKGYILVAKHNAPSPDGSVFDSFGPVRTGADSAVAFFANTQANFSPAEQSFGALFGRRSSGTTNLLARTGQAVADSGVVLRQFSNAPFHLSVAGGRVAFIGTYDLATASRGIFVTTTDGLTPVQTHAIVGTPNPADGTFDRFDEVSINASGSIAFVGHSSGGSGNGLWINYQKVAGDGFFLDGSYSYTTSRVNLNAQGTATFFTLIGNKPGIYAVRNGVIKPVIRKGDPLFQATVTTLSLPTTNLNDNNQVVFNYALSNGKAGIAVATLP